MCPHTLIWKRSEQGYKALSLAYNKELNTHTRIMTTEEATKTEA
jgi:hypothetical protein